MYTVQGSRVAYLLLPHGLPLVDHAADALGALLLLSSQLPQAHRGFGPLSLFGLCFLNLCIHSPKPVSLPPCLCLSVALVAAQQLPAWL